MHALDAMGVASLSSRLAKQSVFTARNFDTLDAYYLIEAGQRDGAPTPTPDTHDNVRLLGRQPTWSIVLHNALPLKYGCAT